MKKQQEEPLLFCRIIQNCSGVKKPQFSGQKIKYKNYGIGDKIKGREHNYSDTPNSFIPCIKTIDGYVLMYSNVVVIGEEHDATVIEDKKPELSEKLKERISRFANISGGASSSMIQEQKRKSKYMVNGALAGGVTLFVYSLVKGGNRTNLFIVGAVLGGMAGKFIAGLKQEE